MVAIRKHPRGLLISNASGRLEEAMVARLEEALGDERLFTTSSGVVVPLEAAEDVLRVLGQEQVDWDAQALAQASTQRLHRQLQLQARFDVAEALVDPYAALADYPRLAKLDPHQVAAVAAMSTTSLRGLGLFDEQGSGKTIMALAAFDQLHRKKLVGRLLVVAPKSALTAWLSDCASFFEDEYRIALVDGPSARRRQMIMGPHDILLVGYETAVSEELVLKTVVAAIPARYMLVVDESYFVKNPSTARAQTIASIRPFCERAAVLCGTPAPNSAVDIVNQITIADGGVAFHGRAIAGDRQQVEVEVASALDHTIYLRRLKDEIFPGMPGKMVDRLLLDLAPTQRAIYERARDDLIVAVRGVDDTDFKRHLAGFIARRVALLQICSNPGALDSRYDEEPAKLQALDQLVRDLVERQGKKVVIWSYFQYSLQSILRRFDRLGVVHIDGTVGMIEERTEAIRRFQEDPDVRVFVGNAAAAGAGITLTAAHHAIYESFSNQAAHYMQSVDRIHRRGQQHDVTYHVLLAHDTVEEAEFDRLLDKERAGRRLLGDKYEEPITRERFLAELGAAV